MIEHSMKIERSFDEDELRELIKEAVCFARRTTSGNFCDEAVVQHVMHERFVDGRWRSMIFKDQHESAKALDDLARMFEGHTFLNLKRR